MSTGWIPLYRSIKEWKYSKDLEMVGLWVHLLTSANHSDGFDRDGNLIKKGSFRTGRKMLSSEFGLSESKVERMLLKLIKGGEIEQQTFSKYRVISISNWSKYQLAGQQTDNKRTAIGQQPDTNNKKEKKEKKENKAACAEIVDYLNLKAATKYRSTTKSTTTKINNLLKDFSIEDFKKAIDIKTTEWKGTDFEKFLRPETLFGPKFEGYLNQNSGEESRTTEKDKLFSFKGEK